MGSSPMAGTDIEPYIFRCVALFIFQGSIRFECLNCHDEYYSILCIQAVMLSIILFLYAGSHSEGFSPKKPEGV